MSGWDLEYSKSGRGKDREYYSHLVPHFKCNGIGGNKGARLEAISLREDLRERGYPKAAVFLNGKRIQKEV